MLRIDLLEASFQELPMMRLEGCAMGVDNSRSTLAKICCATAAWSYRSSLDRLLEILVCLKS
jgi:hypothetical protein